MRPVHRGGSPRAGDFDHYRDAFEPLVSRLGLYCSYCERRIPTNLAVEHIQPKDLPSYRHLERRWENFLLGCVNCNSTKGDKDVVLSDVLLPDRDNTAAAFSYREDGRLEVRSGLTPAGRTKAEATLALVGLDKRVNAITDPDGVLIATERMSQRMETWLVAEESRSDLATNPTDAFRRQVARTAIATGHFSIWMTVFAADAGMRGILIDSFPGTAADCFDPNGNPISPRPPSHGLPHGSKI